MTRGHGVVRAVAVFIVTVLLNLVLWAFLPMLWGWQTLVVTSGSMGPTVKAGDLVVIDPTPAAIHVGDVMTYQRSGSPPITHRVIGRDAAGNYLTKGDANVQADPQAVPPESVVGKAMVLVPLLGLPGLEPHRDLTAGVVLAGLAGAGWFISRSRRRVAAVTAVVIVGVTALPGAGASRVTDAMFVGGTANSGTMATRSQFYPIAIMDAGPVAYWRLGEAGGSVRADAMGSAPLSCSGGTGGFAGALSKDADTATRLPAATAYCRAASGSLLSMTGSFTIILWERAASWPETHFGRLIAKFGGATGQLNYMLAWDSAGTSMRALIDTSSGRYQAIKSMHVDTAWHQVAMSWDSANLRLYVDGLPADGLAAPGTLYTTTAAVTLGFTSADSMAGDLDEVAIFTRAIGSAEIAGLYALA